MLFAIVVDTSASMAVRTALGLSCLDVAKALIERLVQQRQRLQCRDRFLLLCTGPQCICSSWLDPHEHFMEAVKNLKAEHLTDIPRVLREAFDLLNLYRVSASVDCFAQGRRPWSLEPGAVILVTDGTAFTHSSGLKLECAISPPSSPPLPGAHLYDAPFRWDQRLFVLRIQIPALASARLRGADEPLPGVGIPRPSLGALAEQTGGALFNITDKKHLEHAEMLAGHLQHIGVVVDFIQQASVKPTFVYAPSQSHQACWPLPEDVLVPVKLSYLPSRRAHPLLVYASHTTALQPLEHFPLDQYTLESSPLAEFVVKHTPPTTEHVLVVSVHHGNETAPIGFLKAVAKDGGAPSAALFVGPPHFMACTALLRDLLLALRSKSAVSALWRGKWDNFVQGCPLYLLAPLRNALLRWAAVNGLNAMAVPPVPEGAESVQAYSVTQLVTELVNTARAEAEHREQARKKAGLEPRPRLAAADDEATELPTNVFGIAKHALADEVGRLRRMLLGVTGKGSVAALDRRFQLPVGEMGNYAAFLASQQKLRPVRDEVGTLERENAFGSPYRLRKKRKLLDDLGDVDELSMEGYVKKADEAVPKPAKKARTAPRETGRDKEPREKLREGRAPPPATKTASAPPPRSTKPTRRLSKEARAPEAALGDVGAHNDATRLAIADAIRSLQVPSFQWSSSSAYQDIVLLVRALRGDGATRGQVMREMAALATAYNELFLAELLTRLASEQAVT